MIYCFKVPITTIIKIRERERERGIILPRGKSRATTRTTTSMNGGKTKFPGQQTSLSEKNLCDKSGDIWVKWSKVV